MNSLKYKEHNKIVFKYKTLHVSVLFRFYFLDKLWSAMHLLFKGIASY